LPTPTGPDDALPQPADAEGDLLFPALAASRLPAIVTDPRLPGEPIVFVNPAFLAMTGHAVADVLGGHWDLLHGPDTDPATVAEIRRASAEARDVEVEVLNYRKDGSSFWNQLSIAPVRDRTGAVVYRLASLTDVSRRRDAEEGLRQAQKMEALGQLTGGIAHDFNNLLQVIVGYMDAMKPRLADHQDRFVQRGLTRVTEAAERGARLTQQLLAFARKQRLQGRPLSLNALVEAAAGPARSTLGPDVELELDLEPELWTVRCDPAQAELALSNVLANARDAMPAGGRVTIRTFNQTPANITAGEGFSYACLSVADTGEGMEPDVLSRVMEPFFTTKDQGKGTGLGLSMVYGFMKQSGGMAQIVSAPGEGTTVSLLFRATEQPEAALPAQDGAVGADGGSETVLVVDDQADVADLARAILADRGYRTLVAHDARTALAILAEARVDLLFSDLIMPGGMNGVMLAREALRRQPGLRVLLTTGYAEASHERRGAGSAGFEIVAKPYRGSDLAGRVRSVLDAPPPSP
jgi:PAS domain S-box-containing protein